MKAMRMLAGALLLSGGAAQAQPSPVGRTFHYERTNRDGTEPEQIYFHRPAPDRVEVYKMVERCTRAAFVTAFIDPETGVANRFVAARPQPGGITPPYAWIDAKPLDGGGTALQLTIQIGNNRRNEAIAVPPGPWHDYNYDLGTLAAALQTRPGSREPFTFFMTIVSQIPEAPDRIFNPLGEVTAVFTRAENHLGRETLRFEVGGKAFGGYGGGPLWVDARDGFIVDVQWGRPNHDGYKDFRLRLIAEEPSGEAPWKALLARHYEGCPPPSGN